MFEVVKPWFNIAFFSQSINNVLLNIQFYFGTDHFFKFVLYPSFDMKFYQRNPNVISLCTYLHAIIIPQILVRWMCD